jgi:hypothetical protein
MYWTVEDTAHVGEKVGNMNYNKNYQPFIVTGITYSLISDTSGNFGISGDSIYIADSSDLSAQDYPITFAVNDGTISDTANGTITVFDDASSSEWDGDNISLTANHYYVFLRGKTYNSGTSEIFIDAANVRFVAIGPGDYPIFNSQVTSTSYIFHQDNDMDGTLLRGIEVRQGSGANIAFGAKDWSDTLFIDDCKFIGDTITNTGWLNVFRYDRDNVAYNHKIHNCYTTNNKDDVGWYINISGMEIIGCHFEYIGVTPPPSDHVADGFQWGWNTTPGDIINEFRDLRYNFIDHSSFIYKHGFCLGGSYGEYRQAMDTISDNTIFGPEDYSSDGMDYPFNGITMDGTSYAYISRNYIKNVEHGFSNDEFDTRHNTWENNIIINARRLGMNINFGTDSSKIIHNTFIDPAKAPSGALYVLGGAIGLSDTVANNIFDISDGQDIYQETATLLNNWYTDTTGTSYTKATSEGIGDPKFVNKVSLNFHLQSTSPLIDSGYDFNLTYDIEGNIRDASPDIGAYEYSIAAEPYVPVCIDVAYYTSGDTYYDDVKAGNYEGQSFTSSKTVIVDSFRIKGFSAGSPGTNTVTLFPVTFGWIPTTSDTISKGTFDGDVISTDTTTGEWVSIAASTVSGGIIYSGTVYALVISNSGTSGVNEFNWLGDDPGTYAGGHNIYFLGGSWFETLSIDFSFEICGHEITANGRQIRIGNNARYIRIGTNQRTLRIN